MKLIFPKITKLNVGKKITFWCQKILCYQNQNRASMDLINDFLDSNPICGQKLWLVSTFTVWQDKWVPAEFKAG